MITEELMLTTKDNPYNPFNNFSEWFQFDIQKGYNTCGYLARLDRTDSNTDDETFIAVNNELIKDIVANDPTNLFIAVKEDTNTFELANKFSKELKELTQ